MPTRPLLEDGRVTRPIEPGEQVEATVIGHHPWGIELAMPHDGRATVDLRFIDDDPVVFGDSSRWPPIGQRVHATFQGVMPNGQRRVSLRLSDARER